MNGERIGLVLALAGGVALRAWGLGDHGLWIDEYGTAWTIAGDAGECFRRATAIHGQSPLYYWIVQAATQGFGAGPLGLRLPSLVFGVGLLALAWPLALGMFGDRRIALLVVVAFAVNERLVYYSQEARPYGLALLGAAASFHFFVALLGGAGRRARFGYWAATAITWYAHYLFGVVLLVQALWVLFRGPWSRERLRPWLGTFGVLVPLLAPGLLQLVALFRRRQGLDWIEAPSGVVAGLEAAVDLLDPWVVAGVGLALVASRVRSGGLEHRAPAPRVALAAVWLALPVAVFVVLAPLLGVRLLHVRYLAVAIPAVPLLQGWAMSLARGTPTLRALPVLLFLIVSLGLRIEPLVQRDGGRFWWFLQHDWEGAVAELAAAWRPGDLLLHRTGFVEADELVRGTASAATREFVDWPLLAHLPPGHTLRRQPLPYHASPELDAIVADAIERSAPRRVWLLGLDPDDPTSETYSGLLAMASHGPALRPVRRKGFGVVHLVLLKPEEAPR